MNLFKKSLQADVSSSGHTTEEIKDALKEKYKISEGDRYDLIFQDPSVQEYLNNVVAAIMLSHYKRYGLHTGVNMPHRLKAPKSAEAKIQKRIDSAKCALTPDGKIKMTFDPISDFVACKMILRNAPPTRYSYDKKLQQLIERSKNNENFLERMQELKSHFVVDESVKREDYEYIYNYPKKEYYERCKEIIEHLKSLTPKEATNVLEEYNKKIERIEQKISDIDMISAFAKAQQSKDKNIVINPNVEEEDFTNPEINFFDLLEEFSSYLYDDRDLAILTNQFTSLFKDNKTLDSLGISINKREIKHKRTENGYTSNFVILDTLIGRMEVQLQTQHQYREGLTGRAAHSKLKGKEIKPLDAPDFNNPDEVMKFMETINQICPKFFHAKMDDKESSRVLIETYSDYHRYRGLLSEIPERVLTNPIVREYWEYLYSQAKTDKNFSTENGGSQGFIPYDVDKYIASDEFKEFKEHIKEIGLADDTKDEIVFTADEVASDFPGGLSLDIPNNTIEPKEEPQKQEKQKEQDENDEER